MQLKKYLYIFFILGGLHFINDMVAAYFLIKMQSINPSQILFSLVTYLFISFGGQMPVAYLVDQKKNYKFILYISIIISILAISLWNLYPMLSLFLLGIASACIHVCGSALSITTVQKKNLGSALFSSLGILGIAIGSYIGLHYNNNHSEIYYYMIYGLIFLGLLFFQTYKNNSKQTLKHQSFDQHDIIMIVLLMVVSLRSAIWEIFQHLHSNDAEFLMLMGIAACIGKIVGGVVSEIIGNKIYIIISLTLSTILLNLSHLSANLVLIGVGLLQSGIPSCIVIFYEIQPQSPALSSAYVLGLATLLGGYTYFWNHEIVLQISFGLFIIGLIFLISLWKKSKQLKRYK